jgi:hypothetical protein
LLDKRIENDDMMPTAEKMGFKDRSLGDFLRIKRSQKPFLDGGKSTA